jgi:hypothetical protein
MQSASQGPVFDKESTANKEPTIDQRPASWQPPMDEKTQQEILKLAKRNPDKGLQTWQLLTENYGFNPYASATGMRELKVNEYLKGKLEEQSGTLSKDIKTKVTTHLHRNPFKAYEVWQLHTNDKTFDPKTGIATIETQAQNLIDSIKAPVPHNLLQSWKDQIINNPGSVMKQCQEFIKVLEADTLFHATVKEFIKLTETREKLAWNDPQIKKIDTELKKITDNYLNDKNFIKEIEGSRSQVASQRIADEIRERDRAHSPDIGGRGM